jgi:hypothetical protein
MSAILTSEDSVLTLLTYEGRLNIRGLTLLLRVGALWRCCDGLFFEVPPLASDELLTTLHPLLENVLQTVDHFEISCTGAPFSWLEKPINRMGARSGLYGGCSNGVPPIHFFQPEHRSQFRSRLAREVLRKETVTAPPQSNKVSPRTFQTAILRTISILQSMTGYVIHKRNSFLTLSLA